MKPPIRTSCGAVCHARGYALWALCVCLLVAGSAQAGEALVVKTASGKFIPAVASEWVQAAGHSFRFVLRAGKSAPDIAAELGDKIAPIQVKAADDSTLVFAAEGLTEQTLLEKLATIPLGTEKGTADALAALSDLGETGGPALADLSSAGSIRASKKIELPKAQDRKADPGNVVMQVQKVKLCTPLPTILIRVVSAPREGEHKAAFTRGKRITVRGYYKAIDNDNPAMDADDERTRINLKTRELKKGDKVFGKPFIKDGDVWILETIEKL